MLFGMKVVRQVFERGIDEFGSDHQRGGEHGDGPPDRCGPQCNQYGEQQPGSEKMGAQAAFLAPCAADSGPGRTQSVAEIAVFHGSASQVDAGYSAPSSVPVSNTPLTLPT